jgi:serine/threonine protein kinase
VNANASRRNRYLILDVLGQGTFGQVVKCQNLKTQEVVAVKVVKNRTAYFNQSMMEVSVLDLVSNISHESSGTALISRSSIRSSIRMTTTISSD